MLVRARIVLPVRGEPVENGVVSISTNRVESVGLWRNSDHKNREDIVDLGDSILLPGLVNAHCHLDYTDMTGLPPQKHFPDWIKGLLAIKAMASYTDYAAAWLRGAQMLIHSGTTTVADIEAVPELLPDVSSSTPLRTISFLELTGVKSKRKPSEILREASQKIRAITSAGMTAGLSPHALYSTMPALLKQTARVAKLRHWPVAMHVAESIAEQEMYLQRKGTLYEWLKNQRDMSDCDGKTPVQQVRQYGLLGKNFLAVHANYLNADDIQSLAESQSNVVHCPQSHVYFQHAPFRYKELAKARVNVCLGTDSMASILPPRRKKPKLNMFDEMGAFATAHQDVEPEQIVRMATEAGARALGTEDRIGGIFKGAMADLTAIPFTGNSEEAWEAVVHHRGDVSACMIDGQWVTGDVQKQGL